MENSKYSQYIVQQLRLPESKVSERKEGNTAIKRILWMDDDVVKGAFQMNCTWFLHPAAKKPIESTFHKHNANELLGAFSSDPEQPNDLGAEIEFWMEDEKFIINKSSMIFIPQGIKHSPLIVNKIDRPVFHFSTITDGHYLWVPAK
jgi:hypothetical protein